MASIHYREYKSGEIVVRVILRKKNIPTFSLTFDDWIEACKWVEENEFDYYKYPEKYLKWRVNLYRDMRSEKLIKKNHVVRSIRKIPKNLNL